MQQTSQGKPRAPKIPTHPGLQMPRHPRAISPKAVHTAADKHGIAWDNAPGFLKMCKRLVGVAHLDAMSKAQLRKVLLYIELKGAAKKKHG